MRKIYTILVIKIFLLGLLSFIVSCSSEEPDEYKVLVEVSASTDDDIWIEGIGQVEGVYFQKYFKRTFYVEGRNHTIRIRCKNSKALITIRVWVNNKLVKDMIGNSTIICDYLPL